MVLLKRGGRGLPSLSPFGFIPLPTLPKRAREGVEEFPSHSLPPPYQVLVHGVIQTSDRVFGGGGEISSVWEFNLAEGGYIPRRASEASEPWVVERIPVVCSL